MSSDASGGLQLSRKLVWTGHRCLAEKLTANIRCPLAIDLGAILQQRHGRLVVGNPSGNYLEGPIARAYDGEQGPELFLASNERDLTRLGLE